MFGLIKMLWKFAWLAIFILGVRRAIEIVRGKLDEVVDNIEEGESGTMERSLARIHEALHHRQGETVTSMAGSSAVGEPSPIAS